MLSLAGNCCPCSKYEKFIEIIKNNQEAAAKKGVIKITDFRKEMEKENGDKQKDSPSEIKKKAREQYAPYVNESINVLADMIMMGRKTACFAGHPSPSSWPLKVRRDIARPKTFHLQNPLTFVISSNRQFFNLQAFCAS